MTARPKRASDQPDRDEWLEAGLGPCLMAQCIFHGWTLGDVNEVLCADQPTPIFADCLNLELHPLEVLASLSDTTQGSTGRPIREQR